MKSKLLPKLVIFSVLVILVSLPIVTAAMSSASYKLISSSLQGGGAGGATAWKAPLVVLLRFPVQALLTRSAAGLSVADSACSIVSSCRLLFDNKADVFPKPKAGRRVSTRFWLPNR